MIKTHWTEQAIEQSEPHAPGERWPTDGPVMTEQQQRIRAAIDRMTRRITNAIRKVFK